MNKKELGTESVMLCSLLCVETTQANIVHKDSQNATNFTYNSKHFLSFFSIFFAAHSKCDWWLNDF